MRYLSHSMVLCILALKFLIKRGTILAYFRLKIYNCNKFILPFGEKKSKNASLDALRSLLFIRVRLISVCTSS